jgi:hypothetical protein
LEGLDEATLDEILSSMDLRALVEPGCLFESVPSGDLREAGGSLPQLLGATVSLAVATVGDRGFERALGALPAQGPDSGKRRAMAAWGEVHLAKLAALTNGLIADEAEGENLEAGPAFSLAPASSGLWPLLWDRLQPEAKLGIRILPGSGENSAQLSPVFTKAWLIPWLTKKEKKLLAAQAS